MSASPRALAVRAVKRVVQTGLRSPAIGKLANLIAEEHAIVVAAEAQAPVAAHLERMLGLTVRRGPFAGLRYPSHDAVGSSLWPKLLGSYEAELAPTFEALCATPYRTVVDVGAAEGYYAVGLGLRLGEAPPRGRLPGARGVHAGPARRRAVRAHRRERLGGAPRALS